MGFAGDLYAFLEHWAPAQVFWSSAFTAITTVRAARRLAARKRAYKDSAVLTEIAGLPLTLVQSVAFVWAAVRGDVPSMLLFLWWGPGLIATFVAIALSKARGRPVNWHPPRRLISWACKISYVVYMIVFWRVGMPQTMFAFSVWILNDQVEKAFLSEDADRTRRTTHDAWILRIFYPAFLSLPWAVPGAFAFPLFSRVYGVALLALWGAGILFVARRGKFDDLPPDPELLRNIVYSTAETYRREGGTPAASA